MVRRIRRDVPTENSSIYTHGHLRKLNNDPTTYMDGTGEWSTPFGSTRAFVEIAKSFPRIIQVAVTDPNGSAITTGDGKAYIRINELLNGYVLSAIAGHVT